MASVKPTVTFTNEKQKISTHLNYLKEVLKAIDQQIEVYENGLNEYDDLSNKVTEYSKCLRVKINAPLGKKAFLPCYLSRTNEYTVFLGDKHLVKKSAHDTIQYIDRRKGPIRQQLELYQNKKKETEAKINITEELFSGLRGDEVEIIEPYDEKQQKSYARKRLEHQRVSEKDYKTVMSRLDDLEREERTQNELKEGQNDEDGNLDKSRVEEANKTKYGSLQEETGYEPYKEDATRPLEPPKGVPKEDFDKLLRYLNKMEIEEEEDDDDEETDSDELSNIDEEDAEEIAKHLKNERSEAVSLLEEDKPATTEQKSEGHDQSSDKKENVIENAESSQPEPSSAKNNANSKFKRGVHFNSEELGPTAGQQPEPEVKSILRNRDEKPRVDRQYAEWMNKRFDKKVEPGSDSVFKGQIVEKDPLLTLNTTPDTSSTTPDNTPQSKISKFKQNRLKK